MRGIALYIFAGILVVLAMDFIAPPAGLGLAIASWPTVNQSSVGQTVNRTGKSDRMDVPATMTKRRTPAKSQRMLAGCDPVFSPLSVSAEANFTGRCIT